MKTVTRLFLLLVALLPSAVLAQSVSAPSRMNLQGHLYTQGGQAAAGPVNLTVRIYDDAIAGTRLFEETFTGVSVTGSRFSLVIGDNGVFGNGLTSLREIFTLYSEVWVGLTVYGEPELPRRRFATSGFAFRADVAGGAESLACTNCVGALHLQDAAVTAPKLAITCATNQVLRHNGSGWACAEAGTVASVGAGVGLTGGPITSTGSLALAPATAASLGGVVGGSCPTGQVLRGFAEGTGQHLCEPGAGAAIPSGAVMFFDLPSCPSGWSELVAAQGRTLVGLNVGGTASGTVGTPLSDNEDRGHSHGVDPSSATTTAGGGHSHYVDPALVNAATSGSHSHDVNPSAVNSSAEASHTHSVTVDPVAVNSGPGGSHNHAWADIDTTEAWGTYNSSGFAIGFTNWMDGFPRADSYNSAGTLNYLPLGYNVTATGDGNVVTATTSFYTDNEGAHSHSVDVAATTATSLAGASHLHSVDVPNVISTAGGSHTHAVDVLSTTSSVMPDHSHSLDVGSTTTSSASSSMPYLQLLVCRKD